MAGEIRFAPLERAGLADRIVDAIKAMICDHRLMPGDKLPTERDLAQQFNVSRASVREALHSLETLGLIEARVGSGTYLADNPEGILEHLSWVVYFSGSVEKELTEARSILEPEIAALAAKNATFQDMEILAETLQKMEASLGDPHEAAVQDFEFHVALARSAHNTLLQETIVGMQWILRGCILKKLESNPSMEFICLSEHRRIFDAVCRRDAEAARKAMRRSIAESKLFMTEIQEET